MILIKSQCCVYVVVYYLKELIVVVENNIQISVSQNIFIHTSNNVEPIV